jgi:hypothetical protein
VGADLADGVTRPAVGLVALAPADRLSEDRMHLLDPAPRGLGVFI